MFTTIFNLIVAILVICVFFIIMFPGVYFYLTIDAPYGSILYIGYYLGLIKTLVCIYRKGVRHGNY